MRQLLIIKKKKNNHMTNLENMMNLASLRFTNEELIETMLTINYPENDKFLPEEVFGLMMSAVRILKLQEIDACISIAVQGFIVSDKDKLKAIESLGDNGISVRVIGGNIVIS